MNEKIPPFGKGRWPIEPTHHLSGKIAGLVFDHFGDFEGFILETDDAERIHFFSREKHVREVAERAWADRLRVTVMSEEKNNNCPKQIILHPTPSPF